MKLPDVPKLNYFRQTLEWIFDPIGFMERCQNSCGPDFTTKLLKGYAFFSDPLAIQEILTANPHKFDSGKASGLLKPLVGDHSVLLLDGDEHRRMRQLLMPPFHGDKMRSYGKTICEITNKVTSNWQPGQHFTARNIMQDITLQVILQVVFGIDQGDRYEEIKKLLGTSLEAMSSPLQSALLFFPQLQKDLGPWSPWGRFSREQAKLDKLLYAEISDRRKKADNTGNDILSLLLAAQDENGEGMSDQELRDQLITLLIAGHETTATSLAWALYWIHRQPEVYEKLRRELNTLNGNFAPDIISKLPYLNAVCQETLRIYPVAILSFPRVVKSPTKIVDYELEPGSILAACIYLTHRRPDIYPEPEKFKPERFLERQYSPSQYIPFGGGTRSCIGLALAQYEMKLVLATILDKFDLELPSDQPVLPIRRGVTLAPKGGIPMQVKNQR